MTFRHSRGSRIAVALLTVAVVVPAAAWAGQKAVSGQQSLQIKATLTPARAGARGVSMHLLSEYSNAKPGGQQPPYNTKSIVVVEPGGLSVNTSSAPTCSESKVIKANGNASVCPARARVGSGTVTINARPMIRTLISGTVTIYNGLDDGRYGGYPTGSRLLILYIKTSVGVNTSDYLHVVTTRAGVVKLVGNTAKPAKPGVGPGDITLQKLDLTVSGSGRKPYITNPRKCNGSWPVSITVTNWFGQPSITAHDSVKCTSG